MRSFSRFVVLAFAGAVALAGCASPFRSTGLSSAKTGSYDQSAKDYQQRSLVSPGMGLDNNLEPSTARKVGAAAASAPGKVGQSVANGAANAKNWSSDATAAATTSTASNWAFWRRQEASPELYVATARLYENGGNFAGAAQQYEKALKKSPNNVSALLSYAHMMDRQGKLAEATQLYSQAIKVSPREAGAYNDLGLCLARRGMTSDSIRALSKAVELQPDRALYRNNLATALVEQNRTDEALAQLQAVHGEAIAHYNLAYLLQQRHQEVLAQSHFQRAVELNPSFGEARDWAERLALRTPGGEPGLAYRQPVSPATPMAAAQGPAPRAGSYGMAPEPLAGRGYARPDVNSTSSYAQAGNRTGNAAPPQFNRSNIPPTPEGLSSYQPTLDGDLRFLPPVE